MILGEGSSCTTGEVRFCCGVGVFGYSRSRYIQPSPEQRGTLLYRSSLGHRTYVPWELQLLDVMLQEERVKGGVPGTSWTITVVKPG